MDVRIVDDEQMPDGHRWVRVRFDDGREVTFVAVSLALERCGGSAHALGA